MSASKRVLIAVVIVVAGCLIAVMVNKVVTSSNDAAEARKRLEALGTYLVECTTPGPDVPSEANGDRTGHKCYDDGRVSTGKLIGQLQLSIDCVALYAMNTQTEPCAQVDGRLDALKRGEDPFAPKPEGTQ